MSSYSDAANTIAQLYLQKGAAQAEGSRNLGQLLGGAVANIGQTIQNYPAQQAQMREAQQRAEMGDIQIRQARNQERAQQIMGEAYKNATNPDGSVNYPAIGKTLVDNGLGSYWPELQAKMTAAAKSGADLKEQYQKLDAAERAQMGHIAEAAGAVPDAADQATIWTKLVTHAANDGSIDPSHARDSIAQMLGADGNPDPQKVKTTIETAKRLAGSKPITNETELAVAAAGGNLPEALNRLKPPPGAKPPSTPFEAALTSIAKDPAHPTQDEVAAAQGLVTKQPGEEPAITIRTMENGKPVEKVLPRSEAMGKTFPSQPPASVIYPKAPTSQAENDAKDVVESVKGMKDGSIPPILPSRASREYTALMAEAHRQGVNLVKLNEDWTATQKYLSTLNGQQQTRLRQAVAFTKESLPMVEDLAKQWDAGRFPLLNKANLALAKNGAFGQGPASLATKLDAQINDLTSELGTVYKGGNSSTDESLKLATSNLSSNWSKKTLLDNIAQIRKNLEIRENSIRLGSPIANDGNMYAPKASAPSASDPLGLGIK